MKETCMSVVRAVVRWLARSLGLLIAVAYVALWIFGRTDPNPGPVPTVIEWIGIV
jgi:membrane protein YdbS with pleckstrin-like domain